MRFKHWLALIISLLLGIMLLSAGIGKIINNNAFLLSINSVWSVPPAVRTFIVSWLPWFEVLTGGLLVAGVLAQPAALVSAVLSAGLLFHNAWVVSHGMGYKP